MPTSGHGGCRGSANRQRNNESVPCETLQKARHILPRMAALQKKTVLKKREHLRRKTNNEDEQEKFRHSPESPNFG